MKNKWNKMTKVIMADKIFLVLTMLTAGVFMSQWVDLLQTVHNSYTLISTTIHGNFANFYDIALEDAISRGGGILAPNYNILIYILIAIWIFPIYLAAHCFKFPFPLEIGVVWTELLVVLMAGIMAKLLKRIAEEIGYSKELSGVVSYIAMSSMLVIFGSVGFGQIDIVGLNISLVAILFYVRKENVKFCITVSLALCFKGFAILFLIPFVLLREKRLIYILKYLMISSFFPLITRLLFAGSQGYGEIQNIMAGIYHFKEKIWSVEWGSGIEGWNPFIVFMILLCVWAYQKEEGDDAKCWIFAGVCAFSVFAIFILWHPQWLIFGVPFLALAFGYVVDRKLYLLLDIIFNIGYVLLTCFQFANNADDKMVVNGLLKIFINWSNLDYHFLDIWKRFNIPNAVVMSLMVSGILGMVMMIYKNLFFSKGGIIQKINIDRTLIYLKIVIFYVYFIFAIWIHIL